MPHLRTEGLTGHLVFAIAAGALGAAFQHGYNTGVVNAPQTLVQNFISNTYRERNNAEASEGYVTFIFSLMVSIFCLGGMLGALATAFMAERFGRKGALLINNILVFLSAALLGFSKLARSYEMLIIGRFIIGINSGLNAGLSPMYLTEISPVHLRGAVGTIYQLIITFSILISQIFGLPELLGTADGWPILFGIIIVPSIFMIVTLPLCPESPKYILINKGRDVAAQNALNWLRGTTEVHYEMDQMRAESEAMRSFPKVTLKEMCTSPSYRQPLVIAVVIMLSQQFSGINAVIFYSTKIFMSAGLTARVAVFATLGMGTINVLMTVVSMVLVEKAGRRTLHLIGLGGMTIVTVLLTLSMALTSAAPWLSYVSMVLVIAFVVMFATGPGSIPWFLVTELFNQSARPMATSIAVAVNWSANFVVGIAFLPIKEVLHVYTFLIFTVMLIGFWLFTYNRVPETKGRTVEEIAAQFQDKSHTKTPPPRKSSNKAPPPPRKSSIKQTPLQESSTETTPPRESSIKTAPPRESSIKTAPPRESSIKTAPPRESN